MNKFFIACLYQNYSEELSQEKIIEELFPFDAKFMEYNTLYSSIIYKKNIYIIFENLLLFADKDDNTEDS